MKKELLVLISFCFFIKINYAQTEVSGGIFEPTTWTLAESPYIVISDVVVFPDANLTIEPGVEIRFYPDTRLELRAGDLNASGSEGQPILFTRDTDDPASTDRWHGIENTSPQGEAITVTLKHVIFEYAKTAVNYGGGTASRTIENAIFRFNDRGAFDGAQGYNWVTISDSEFTGNGIGMEGRMSAINCTFQENEVGFGNPMTFANINSGARVTNCTFTDNGLAVGTIGQIITIAIIENSTFTDNEKGFFGYWANIDNSTFINSSEVGVFVTKGDIRNSSFNENEIGLQVNIFPGTLSIYDNVFSENNTGLEIEGAGAEIFDNTICNNIEAGARLTTDQPIDLNFNCWCTSNQDEIAALIIDAYDDVSLGIASYDSINTECIGGLVFPGDANNDGMVNNSDALIIGLTYGISGAARTDASTNWVGQTADDWSYTMPNNVNAKHADANGDGIVNTEDFQMIEQNYGAIHNYLTDFSPVFANNESYNLEMEVEGLIEGGAEITLNISFAGTANPIEDFYGLAFNLESDQLDFSELDMQIDLSNTALGTSNLLSIQNSTEQAMEMAMVRSNQEGILGEGLLASAKFTLPESFNETQLNLRIANITAINSMGLHLQIEELEETYVVTNLDGVGETYDQKVNIFPNPVQAELNIEAPELTIEKIIITNAKGQIENTYDGQTVLLNVGHLSNGLYNLQLITEQGTILKRLVVLN